MVSGVFSLAAYIILVARLTHAQVDGRWGSSTNPMTNEIEQVDDISTTATATADVSITSTRLETTTSHVTSHALMSRNTSLTSSVIMMANDRTTLGNTSEKTGSTALTSSLVTVNESLTSSTNGWSTEHALDNRLSTKDEHVTSVTSSDEEISSTSSSAATRSVGNSSESGTTENIQNTQEIMSSHTSRTVDNSLVMTSSPVNASATRSDDVTSTVFRVTTETRVRLHSSITQGFAHDLLTSSVRRVTDDVSEQSSSGENGSSTQTRHFSHHVTSTHYSVTSDQQDVLLHTTSSTEWPLRVAVLAGSIAGVCFMVFFLIVIIAVFACRSKVRRVRSFNDSRVRYKDSDVRVDLRGSQAKRPRRPPSSPDGSDFDGSYIPLPRSAPPSALGGAANIFKGAFPQHQDSANASTQSLSQTNNLFEKDSDQESVNGFAMSTFTARNASYRGILKNNEDYN